MVAQNENPRAATRGFSCLIIYNGKTGPFRLITVRFDSPSVASLGTVTTTLYHYFAFYTMRIYFLNIALYF